MIRRLPVLLLSGLLACSRLLGAEAVAPIPTEITSEHFESVSTDTEMTTLFERNVILIATDLRITCDRLVVVSLRKGPKDQIVGKQNQFKSLVATGHVKIVQGERVATCGRAEVLPGEDRITLTETPVVEDKERGITWMGDYLFLLKGERRVQGKNARIIGPPIKDLSYLSSEKPAAEQPKAAK